MAKKKPKRKNKDTALSMHPTDADSALSAFMGVDPKKVKKRVKKQMKKG